MTTKNTPEPWKVFKEMDPPPQTEGERTWQGIFFSN